MKELKIIKYIFKNLFKNVGKNKAVLFFIGSAFIALLTIIEPLFFREIIEILEKYFSTGEKNLERLYQILGLWGIFIIIFLLFKGIYSYKLWDILNFNYIKDFNYYSEKLLGLSHQTYLNSSKGQIQKALDDGVEKSFSIFNFFFSFLFPSISIPIFVSIFLFFLDWRMAIATLLMLPLLLLVSMYLILSTSEKQDFIEHKWMQAFYDFSDALSNNPLLKIFSIKYLFVSKISSSLDYAYSEQLKINVYWAISNNIQTLFVIMSRFLVLGFGAYFIFEGTLSFALLFLFYAYIEFVYGPIILILEKIFDYRRKLLKIGLLIEEIDKSTFDKDDDNGENFLKNVSGEIEFKNVSFSYNDGKEVFNDLNFKIKKGEKVAFVGSTGAGKSTITNLLFRFWDVNKGGIFLDGVNIKDLKKDNLRSHIGIVMQDNLLFNASIKDNLLFSKPKLTDEDLENALKESKADFVFDLKKGINTKVGERGLKLSGGEKQRLSIARLFLKNPEIFILDEATSALDTKTEKSIQESLDTLMRGRTSIIIAHRLSTVKKADRIFVLELGKIVEIGSYDKLIDKKGVFFNLVNPDKLVI